MIQENALLIEASASLGRRLCREAVWLDNCCTWIGDAFDSPPGAPARHVLVGGDFYGGTAGIAYFLADLTAATGEPLFAEAAVGALQYSITKTPELNALRKFGLFDGVAGVAFAQRACQRLIPKGADFASEEYPDSFAADHIDVISGMAGLILHKLLGDRDDQISARAYGKQLLRWQEHCGPPLQWHSPQLAGFAHGFAGIAAAFLELFLTTKDNGFLAAYEDTIFSLASLYDEKLRGWPDLRHNSNSGSVRPVRGIGWCHGAPGILLPLIRAALIGKERAMTDIAQHAYIASWQGIVSRLSLQDDDYSLCHGLIGDVACTHHAAQLLSDQTIINQCKRVASLVARQLSSGQALSGSTDKTPQLMLGMAGLGHAFLQIAERSSTPFVLYPTLPTL